MPRKRKLKAPDCPKCSKAMNKILIQEDGGTSHAEWNGSRYKPIFTEVTTSFICNNCGQVIGTCKPDNIIEGFVPELEF